jgi:ABC-type Mn2+/Zn2+ transport system permease subunit
MSFIHALLDPFRYDFMQRGLLCAVLLGISGGLLGAILVLRRLSLMGDALAHSLLPGIGIAYLCFGASTAALFAGALLAGLITALGSALLSRLTRIKEDAAFGSLFIVLFGLGVAMVNLANTRINLMHFLFGNVLGVSNTDLGLTASSCLITVLVFVVFYRHILLETFDPSFYRATGGRGGWVHMGVLALTVLNLVAGLQTMGVVLSLGLFLLPAVSAYLWCDRLQSLLFLSSGIAVVCAFFGILLSYHASLPSGASIVLCLGCVFVVSALCSPRHGLLSKFRV